MEALSAALHETELLSRTWLTGRTFDCELSRPPGFRFLPGQCIRLRRGGIERDYSLSSSDTAERLEIHVRLVPGGAFSPWLAEAPMGTRLSFSGPHGFFTFGGDPRVSLFVATGVGIAPFLSMARSGLRGFSLLHGARSADELCHRRILEEAAASYVGCMPAPGSGARTEGAAELFTGRVTDWLAARFPRGRWSFHLCGRREMIRDVTLLVDERAPGSLVFTEIFS
jgi:benzoate/toluate 1,2-dioxygenase reductase component